uniref:SH3 domain-containing protein n=1 Tax=Ciona intestinalis TaxID=7719 RepID=H2XZS0_CIOIN
MKELQGKYNLDACLPDLPEIEIAKQAGILASKTAYRSGLSDVLDRFKGFQRLEYKDYADVQRSLKAAEISDNEYKSAYEKNKANYTPIPYTPDMIRFRALSNVMNLNGNVEYTKAADKAKSHYTLAPDAPDFIRAKKAAESSNKEYKEDWEYDKQVIYYPVHMTPGYEQTAEVKQVQKDVKYKNEYEKNRGRNHTEIPETHEMSLSHKLQPVLSKKQYTQKSKEQQKNVHVGSVHITPAYEQAADVKKVQSDATYKEGYNKGKDKNKYDVTTTEKYMAAKELENTSSDADYHKDAEEMMHHHTLPVDAPEFIRAKEAAKIASNLEYQKQKKEVIDKYRGFQTMDSSDHPIVQQGIKVAEMVSNATYKEGYNKGKDKNKYDVTATEKYMAAKELENTSSDVKYKSAYEMNKDVQEISHAVSTQQQASKQVYKEDFNKNIVGKGPQDPAKSYPEYDLLREVSKQASKATYKEGYNKEKDKNKYDVTATEQYKFAKELENTSSNVNYKNEYEKNKGKNQTSIPETHEMSLSKELQPVLSKKQYTQKSKDQQKNVHITRRATTKRKIRTSSMSQILNNQVYKEDFKKNIVGKGPQDPAKSYPEYDLLRQVSKQASKVKYKSAYEMNKGKNQTSIPETHEMSLSKELQPVLSKKQYTQKEADKMMHTHNLPLDYPEFVRAKENAINASDAEYVREADKMMHTHNLPLDYPEFVRAKENAKNASDKNYPDGLGPFHSVSETHEMERAKSLQPLKETVYSKEASVKKGTQGISHALLSQKNMSRQEYLENFKNDVSTETNTKIDNIKSKRTNFACSLFQPYFKKNVVGKAPADLTGSYPEYDHAREVSKMISKRKYKEDYMADKDIIYYPVHLTPGYEAAVKSNEHQSDVIYKGCQEKIGRLQ